MVGVRRGVVALVALVAASLSCAAILGVDEVDYAGSGDAATDANADTQPAAEGGSDAGADTSAAVDACAEPIDAGPCLDDAGLPIDLTNDQGNCGRCRHDCLGGTCKGGLCQPVTIYREPNDGGVPVSGGGVVGVVGGSIYFTYPDDIPASKYAVRRLPSDANGGQPATTIAHVTALWAAAIDGEWIYYVTNPSGGYLGLSRSRLDAATPATPDPLATFQETPLGGHMAFDDTNVYIASGYPNVLYGPKDGGTLTVLAPGTTPKYVDRSGSIVAWLDLVDGGGVLGRWTGNVVAPIDAGHPSSLVADGARFVWWNAETGRLTRIDANGTTLEAVGAPLLNDGGAPTGPAQGLVPDGARYFVLLSGMGPIVRYLVAELSLCGEPPLPRYAFGDLTNGSIVGDDKAIYWSSYGGNVYRLAK